MTLLTLPQKNRTRFVLKPNFSITQPGSQFCETALALTESARLSLLLKGRKSKIQNVSEPKKTISLEKLIPKEHKVSYQELPLKLEILAAFFALFEKPKFQ